LTFFSATNCAVLISKVAETYKASQACTWVCDFYANKICGISFLKFTLLDWRSAPFSICEVCFFIWLNYHHSTHKEHCNELGVLAAGSCGCHCKSCSSLREAAEHKCAQQELRCGDEELTFRNPWSSLLLIREGHISCYFSLDILARWNIILFLFDIVKLHVQKSTLGVHSCILDSLAGFSKESSTRPHLEVHLQLRGYSGGPLPDNFTHVMEAIMS
jgi:hypothetical protein